MDERKGVLTPNQEKGLDDLIELEGLAERFDGVIIKLVDNQVIERLKGKIPVEHHETVYAIIDEVFRALGIEP